MPRPRNHVIYVNDMREAVRLIGEYVDGYDYEAFRNDRKTTDAVLRNFEILGEAAGRVPEDIRALAPDIDWRRIKDFRNVIAHFYSGVNLELVWELMQVRLPEHREALDRLHQKLPAPKS